MATEDPPLPPDISQPLPADPNLSTSFANLPQTDSQILPSNPQIQALLASLDPFIHSHRNLLEIASQCETNYLPISPTDQPRAVVEKARYMEEVTKMKGYAVQGMSALCYHLFAAAEGVKGLVEGQGEEVRGFLGEVESLSERLQLAYDEAGERSLGPYQNKQRRRMKKINKIQLPIHRPTPPKLKLDLHAHDTLGLVPPNSVTRARTAGSTIRGTPPSISQISSSAASFTTVRSDFGGVSSALQSIGGGITAGGTVRESTLWSIPVGAAG
ncbi:hypothetical protein HK097_003883, partial [Rhizophlyctis rosea]